MMDEIEMRQSSQQRCMVVPANALRVDTGANMGEALGCTDEVNSGDIYTLSRLAKLQELVTEGQPARVSSDSSIGAPGAKVETLANHKLMGARGAMIEVALLAIGEHRVILPHGPLSSGDDYTLMQSSAPINALTVRSATGISAGTRVTLSNGLQKPIEQLTAGDRLLTRDNGPQAIQWIGHQTERAEGNRAPIFIERGALNAARDLVVAPDHRLFVYQRQDAIGAGRAEILVRARHLVNHENIFPRAGGHMEYYHLLLPNQEIIYLEGIQAESLRLEAEVLAGFHDDLRADLTKHLSGITQFPSRGVEPTARDLLGVDAAQLLKQASCA